MKQLKNWDNKTWLASKAYIDQFTKYVRFISTLKRTDRILDVGCGRANIISRLHSRFKLLKKPVGLDLVKHKNPKQNITFVRSDAVKYLRQTQLTFDLILIKQSLHLLSKAKRTALIKLCQAKLNTKGRLLIFTLKTKGNQIPTFKAFKQKLDQSLKQDEKMINQLAKLLKPLRKTYFKFKVAITKQDYIKHLKNRYISSLLDFSNQQIQQGIKEIKQTYPKIIKFNDVLICLTYKKR